MKKVFAIIALMGVFTFGMTQTMSAQDEEAIDTAAVEQVDSAAVEEPEPAEAAIPEATKEEVSMYKQLKIKFIEGDAGFMAIVAIALIIGLAFCIERIIYL
ncbi:MAG: MotA/TolQ/ExbB proton channel family protein, partial [Bacteroidaceae bacterium]|nr:MotA/TolQ/ExbB proton channel family protein [Bacteroidaceae bacterium]